MESWVHVNELSGQGDKELIVTVDPNNSSADRQTQITGRTLNGITDILTIIQRGVENMDSIVLFAETGAGDAVCYANGSFKATDTVPEKYRLALLAALNGYTQTMAAVDPIPLVTCVVLDPTGTGDWLILPYKLMEKEGRNGIIITVEGFRFTINSTGQISVDTI